MSTRPEGLSQQVCDARYTALSYSCNRCIVAFTIHPAISWLVAWCQSARAAARHVLRTVKLLLCADLSLRLSIVLLCNCCQRSGAGTASAVHMLCSVPAPTSGP